MVSFRSTHPQKTCWYFYNRVDSNVLAGSAHCCVHALRWRVVLLLHALSLHPCYSILGSFEISRSWWGSIESELDTQTNTLRCLSIHASLCDPGKKFLRVFCVSRDIQNWPDKKLVEVASTCKMTLSHVLLHKALQTSIAFPGNEVARLTRLRMPGQATT